MDVVRMNATEVMERSKEMAEQLGRTFGRLQNQLLSPLAQRAAEIIYCANDDAFRKAHPHLFEDKA